MRLQRVFVVLLVLALAGCLESNPQPSPLGRQDMGGPGPGGGGEKGADGTVVLEEVENRPPFGPDSIDGAHEVSGLEDLANGPEVEGGDTVAPELTGDLCDLPFDAHDLVDVVDLSGGDGDTGDGTLGDLSVDELEIPDAETIDAVEPDDDIDDGGAAQELIDTPTPCTSHGICGADELCLDTTGADWPIQQVCGLCGEEEECNCQVPVLGDFAPCEFDADCLNNWCGDGCDDCGPCPPCIQGYCVYSTFDVPECVCTPCA